MGLFGKFSALAGKKTIKALAGTPSRAITTAIAAPLVVGGASAAKKGLVQGNINQYDNVFNKASSTLDELYFSKVAEDEEDEDTIPEVNDYSKDDKHINTPSKIMLGALGAAFIADGIIEKNPVAPIRNFLKGVKIVGKTVPELILNKTPGGRQAVKAFKNFINQIPTPKGASKSSSGQSAGSRISEMLKNDKVESGGFDIPSGEGNAIMAAGRRTLTGMGIGFAIGTGNLAAHMIGDKYFDKKTVKKSYNALPTPIVQQYVGLKNKDEKKDRQSYFDKKQNSPTYNKRHLKSASEIIDMEFEKLAGPAVFSGPKHFIKKILKEDIAQNAVGSIPFFVVPAVASQVVGRDLRGDGKKLNSKKSDRITVDVPLSSLNKTAGIFKKKINLYEIPTWKHFMKYEMPSRAARSLAWSLPATAMVAATGRNVRGAGEKLNPVDKTPLAKGNARITIETGAHTSSNEIDPRMASDILEGLFKTALLEDVKKNENISLE